ncbi:hypothetical protein EDB87DRAFT_1679262 [Lactarius vividus]|nr:hypothetical protein EDB87DRAFT_1679262 [Lactarius vividus]
MPATFEIPFCPSITEYLCTFQTPGSDRRLTEDPATSHRYRSITHDRKRGKMTLEWANEEFLSWLAAEDARYSGGIRSGKNAAPDVRTAAQNADARPHITSMTDGAEVPPSQPTKRRRKRASTPPPPPSSAPVPGPSAQFTWYPNAAYSQVPYHVTYPMYLPYSHFPPPILTTPAHNRLHTLEY